jgi:hypothetical protein
MSYSSASSRNSETLSVRKSLRAARNSRIWHQEAVERGWGGKRQKKHHGDETLSQITLCSTPVENIGEGVRVQAVKY